METTFASFNLKESLVDGLAKIHFTKPTPVQEEVIPILMAGHDAIVQSQTGSGKTHAFLLPFFSQLKANQDLPQLVITSPSRELAMQTYDLAKQVLEASGETFRMNLYVGGSDKERQIEKLGHQQPDIVIGTPGRILDLISSAALRVDQVRFLVIDEADMTLDMGFLKDVDAIASKMPEQLQMAVFSATIPDKLQPFLRKYLNAPEQVKLAPKSVINPNVQNWLFATRGKNKADLVAKLLTVGQPYLALVFANTKQTVDELAAALKAKGLKVAKIHGGLKPRERKRIMKQVENLEYQYVVATDLAARGIDIPGASLVINYEIPADLEYFVHRVGRTGRNGLDGTAITLYGPDDEQQVNEIEALGIKFTPKTLSNGQIVDSYDRQRRTKRQATKEKLDPKMVGMVKKQQRKHKPGYRNKIKKALSEDRRAKRKIENRQEQRATRRSHKR